MLTNLGRCPSLNLINDLSSRKFQYRIECNGIPFGEVSWSSSKFVRHTYGVPRIINLFVFQGCRYPHHRCNADYINPRVSFSTVYVLPHLTNLQNVADLFLAGLSSISAVFRKKSAICFGPFTRKTLGPGAKIATITAAL